MSDHMTEWLGAYLDGELHGLRWQRVQAHLADCESCRAELQSLKDLSAELHEAPLPEFTSTDRFASQVNLRLPHHQAKPVQSKALEIGWWMIPVSLLAIWVLLSAASFAGDVVSAAENFGVVAGLPSWLTPADSATWSAALGHYGILNGESLQWAEQAESFTRTVLPQLVWQVSIALLYLSWIATWWARHTRQGHGQPVES